MAQKKVVLVESPAKARTIQKFVGKDTVVKATFGHIRDLPKSTIGVDTANDFTPKYIVPKKAAPVVKELKTLVKNAEAVYLATDPDREGEAIAWHVMQALDLSPDSSHRILFHEITKPAITHALTHPGKLNESLVDAQQARRVLDRLVGYELSPLLWRKIYRGLSAGRVQSVALRLITDREAEIKAFTSKEYWSLWATFLTEKKEEFAAKLEQVNGKSMDKYPEKALIEKAQELSSAKDWVVVSRTAEKKQRHPKPPFTTSTLQQEASHKLRLSVKQTMMVAQRLYEGVNVGGQTVGLITYMRTDSLNMATEAVEEARKVIASKFGATYAPDKPRVYKTKSKGAQEAHEAIRPTSFDRHPNDVKAALKPEEFKLYKLIWERAIASQMSSAQLEATQLRMGLDINKNDVIYLATGQRVLFPGFMKAYEEVREEETDEGEQTGEQLLPAIDKGDHVTLDGLEPKQHFTQPPARYSEATLVREMERLGIGRPSTYAPTIATVIDRGYVKKEEGRLHPEEIGFIVIDLLKEKFPRIVDYDFTADMEEQLDAVARGETAWNKVIADFYKPFHTSIEVAEKEIDKKEYGEQTTDEKCPQCDKPLIIKRGRFGRFFACTGFPECRYTRQAGESGEKEAEEAKLVEGRKCPQDEGDLIIKRGRYGPFIACSNYPECKYVEAIVKESGVPCPKDGGAIIERRSKRGKLFWGCKNYPKCDFVAWDKPLATPCPKCKGLMVEKKSGPACTQCEYKEAKQEASGEA